MGPWTRVSAWCASLLRPSRGTAASSPRRRSLRLGFEACEPRQMLAADPFAAWAPIDPLPAETAAEQLGAFDATSPDALVLGLTDAQAYQATYGLLPAKVADRDGDGDFDLDDLSVDIGSIRPHVARHGSGLSSATAPDAGGGSTAMPSGDMDLDGDLDLDDVDDFVLGLTDAAAYQAMYGVPPSTEGDLDGDGDLDLDDVDDFVIHLTDHTPPGDFMVTGPLSPVTTPNPIITWSEAIDDNGMVSYDLRISGNDQCVGPFFFEAFGISDTSQQVNDDLSNADWYVCLTARDGAGNETEAAAFAFSVDAPVHVIFATSQTYDITDDNSGPPYGPGLLGSLEAADWHCTDHAFSAGLIADWDFITIHYRAILSSSSVNAKDRLAISGEVRNTVGNLIAVGKAELFDAGGIGQPIGFNEFGGGTGGPVWTGTMANGDSTGATCGNAWDDDTETGTIGAAANNGIDWLNNNTKNCDEFAKLYCISQ